VNVIDFIVIGTECGVFVCYVRSAYCEVYGTRIVMCVTQRLI
jgi:hypothetical protein